MSCMLLALGCGIHLIMYHSNSSLIWNGSRLFSSPSKSGCSAKITQPPFLPFSKLMCSLDTVYKVFSSESISLNTKPRYFSSSLVFAMGSFFFSSGCSQSSIQQRKCHFGTDGGLRASRSTPNFSNPRSNFSSSSPQTTPADSIFSISSRNAWALSSLAFV